MSPLALTLQILLNSGSVGRPPSQCDLVGEFPAPLGYGNVMLTIILIYQEGLIVREGNQENTYLKVLKSLDFFLLVPL